VLKFAKITWPTGAIEVVPLDAVGCVFDGFFPDAAVGELWLVEVIEMNEMEFQALPEFDGP
jgi:hypothetical protein